DWIEILVVALEGRRIRHLESGRRQPAIPDRIDGAANGRDVVLVGEDRVFLLREADAAELARQVGKIADLDTGDVVEIAGIIAIGTDAIGDSPDAARRGRDHLVKALPQAGNAGAVIVAEAIAEACDQDWLAGFKTRRLKCIE